MNKKQRRKKKSVILRNKKLVKKYPWLAPRDYWSGRIIKDYDYSWILWGCTPGWDAAYGDMYLKELGEAVEKAGAKHNFVIEQIKEKYGEHRVYSSIPSDEVKNIIDKYCMLSKNICISCGKPDVPMLNDSGWFYPSCYKCFEKNVKFFNRYTKHTQEEIKKRYDEIKSNECYMPETYIRKIYSKEGTEEKEIDISETVVKIRKRWDKRNRKRKNHEESH